MIAGFSPYIQDLVLLGRYICSPMPPRHKINECSLMKVSGNLMWTNGSHVSHKIEPQCGPAVKEPNIRHPGPNHTLI